MSALQRLIAGFGFGCLITILVFPATRAFILHPIHFSQVQETLDSFPLSGVPAPIPEPKEFASLTNHEVTMIAVRIADFLNIHSTEEISQEEAGIAIEFFDQCRKSDQDNAIWSQLLASVRSRTGDNAGAMKDWHSASSKTRFSFAGHELITHLWKQFALAEGRQLAWQGILALKQRRTAVPMTIGRTADAMLRMDTPEARLLSLRNLDLMREGANSLAGARRASEGSLRSSRLAPTGSAKHSPADREQQYISFETEVRESLGPEAAIEALTLMRRNDAWIALLQPEETIRARDNGLTFQAVAAALIPAALFWSGVMLSFVALVGSALVRPLRKIPHPNKFAMLGIGGLLAAWSLLEGSVWMVAVWYLFVGIMLAWPVEIADPSPIKWNALNRTANAILATVIVGLLMIWLASVSPASLVVADSSQLIDRLLARPQTWLELAAGVLSLAVPSAAVWARMKRKSPLALSVESISKIALYGAVFSLIATIFATPICLFWDKQIQSSIQLKVVNEPAFHRIIQP